MEALLSQAFRRSGGKIGRMQGGKEKGSRAGNRATVQARRQQYADSASYVGLVAGKVLRSTARPQPLHYTPERKFGCRLYITSGVAKSLLLQSHAVQVMSLERVNRILYCKSLCKKLQREDSEENTIKNRNKNTRLLDVIIIIPQLP